MGGCSLENVRVLLAEDEPFGRLGLKTALESLGHTVVAEAENGDDALRLARSERPDIAVLDIRMPGIDGLEVARILNEEAIAPALIVSAYSDQEYIRRSTESGCLYYLIKPVRPEDLRPAIAITLTLSRQMTGLREEVRRATEALETRRLVERAKGMLVERYCLKEHEALMHLQQKSMATRRPLREVAEAVIRRFVGPRTDEHHDAG